MRCFLNICETRFFFLFEKNTRGSGVKNSKSFLQMSHWVKLHTPVLQGQDARERVLSSLRSFYYSHDTVTADFDAHVRCVHVKENADFVTLEPLSPILDAYVLFYTFHVKEKQVYVWGGLRYDQIEDGEAIDMIKIRSNRSCAFVMRSVVEQVREEKRNVEFSIPTARSAVGMEGGGDMRFKSSSFSDAALRAASEKEVNTRLDWYMKIEHDQKYSPPPATPARSAGVAECAPTSISSFLSISYTLLHLVPRNPSGIYDGRYMCNRFRQMIVHAETMHLYNQLYMMHEDDVYRFLLLQNSHDYCTLVKTPTVQNHREFVDMYPTANILLCKRWIQVKMEEVPDGHLMAVERGGMVHLPVYWEAVFKWLALRFEQSVQRHFTEHARSHVAKGPQEIAWARSVGKFIMTDKPVIVTVSFNEKSSNHAPVDETHGVFVSDIEDMWKTMPPCMQQLKNKGRFPRNGERLYFIPAMWNGGYSMAAIENLLNAMNDRWPKSPPETVAHRANPRALIQRDKGVHWCSNVIKHTLQKREDALHCPFVDETSTTADACGAKCAASLGLRYPVKAPHNVIKVMLKKRGGGGVGGGATPSAAQSAAEGVALVASAEGPPAPPARSAGVFSSSSSSEDEEEKYERKWKKNHIEI